MGYHRAGFDVVGVDINRQRHFPFPCIKADVFELDWLDVASRFDAVHASPPCQAYTRLNAKRDGRHPALIPQTRELLESWGLPYVIENVEDAPLRCDLMLCGSHFKLRYEGFELRRHRIFELSWSFPREYIPRCDHSELPAAPVFGHSSSTEFRDKHGFNFDAAHRAAIMGIDWMSRDGVAEAIPPVFTEFIGEYLLEHLQADNRQT